MTQICVSKLVIIGSDNGLSPGWREVIIWTNAGIFLIRPFGTNFSEMLIEIRTFTLKKMRLKMSSGKLQPFCHSLNVLTQLVWVMSDFQWWEQSKTHDRKQHKGLVNIIHHSWWHSQWPILNLSFEAWPMWLPYCQICHCKFMYEIIWILSEIIQIRLWQSHWRQPSTGSSNG